MISRIGMGTLELVEIDNIRVTMKSGFTTLNRNWSLYDLANEILIGFPSDQL